VPTEATMSVPIANSATKKANATTIRFADIPREASRPLYRFAVPCGSVLESESEYAYRPPRWTTWLVLVGFALPLVALVAIAFLPGMLLFGVGCAAVVLLEAWLYLRFVWCRDWVVVDAERIRWPRTRRELRWDEIVERRIVRVLWTEYVRVTDRAGKVRWIGLNQYGGQELRARVVAALGLE